MAHEIEDSPQEAKPKKKKLNISSIIGRCGFSFVIGKKEIFVGVGISDVEEDLVKIRKKRTPGSGRVCDL